MISDYLRKTPFIKICLPFIVGIWFANDVFRWNGLFAYSFSHIISLLFIVFSLPYFSKEFSLFDIYGE